MHCAASQTVSSPPGREPDMICAATQISYGILCICILLFLAGTPLDAHCARSAEGPDKACREVPAHGVQHLRILLVICT